MWTYPPKRILAAVDFGDASAAALRAAGALARAYHAHLTALHAESFDAPPYFTSDQVDAIERQRRAARRDAAGYLKTFAHAAGVEVTPVIAEGSPASTILRSSQGEDLIVMGTHGRRGPARWWAGSVAERVVRESTIPVLIVRAGQTTAGEMSRRIVLVSTDGVFDGAGRRYAEGLASSLGGAFHGDVGSSPDATLQLATLVVVPYVAGPSFSLGRAARTVRSCERPLLFVPMV